MLQRKEQRVILSIDSEDTLHKPWQNRTVYESPKAAVTKYHKQGSLKQ